MTSTQKRLDRELSNPGCEHRGTLDVSVRKQDCEAAERDSY